MTKASKNFGETFRLQSKGKEKLIREAREKKLHGTVIV